MNVIDSHCHLHLMDTSIYEHGLDSVMTQAQEAGVTHLLCVSVAYSDYLRLTQLAVTYPNVWFSVGEHPSSDPPHQVTLEQLMEWTSHPKCVALGETGLDFYRVDTPTVRREQRDRFALHIQAALKADLPLIIHTRAAAKETIDTLKQEHAEQAGGVMHCFTESWEVAVQALDLGFYISFSGIVSFKNAEALREVAKKVPKDRLLIETDSPYLAPAPYRGQQNQPALVARVAEVMAEIRGCSLEEMALLTTENFHRCFRRT